MSRKHVEYLLIGSGVAASTLATRLLEREPATSITILESGKRIPSRDRRIWWDYIATNRLPYEYTYDDDAENESTGNTTWTLYQNRVTAFGGTTVHWGGWTPRMKPEDFRLLSNTGQGGDWLLDYDELEPYYCQAETHLSVSGDSDDPWVRRSAPYTQPPYPYPRADEEIMRAFAANGLRFGPMPIARYNRCMSTGTCRYCPFGARFNAQYILEDLEARYPDNFNVITNATVTEILMKDRKRAEGVRYLCLGEDEDGRAGQYDEILADKVVVCAGAYESPKLLINSGHRFYKNGIGNDYEQVGHYLVSHSFLSVTGTSAANKDKLVNEFDFPTVMTRDYDTEAEQSRGKVLLFRNQLHPSINWANLMQSGKTRAQLDDIATGPRMNAISAFYEEKGQYENYLQPLPGKPDQFGRPRTRTHFSRSERDLRAANERLHLMSQIFASIPDYRVIDANFGGAAGFHASGTCRMSSSPESGVTDGDLRVHDTDNLYVLSNAVFPSVGAVNPTLTLVALAFRLGDHFSGRGLKLQAGGDP